MDPIKHLESEKCKTLQLDVTDGFDAIQAKVQEAMNVWGKVDVVVNNAGIGSPGITEEAGSVVSIWRMWIRFDGRYRAAGYLKAFNINLFGAMNVTVAFLPFLRAQKSGTIVLMGSRHAWKSQHAVSLTLIVRDPGVNYVQFIGEASCVGEDCIC